MDDRRGRLDRLIARMKAEREPWEDDWRQCETLCSQFRSQMLATTRSTRARQKGRYNRALYDGYGTYASSVCSNGLASGLMDESQKWMAFRTYDDALMEKTSVKNTLGDCERRMFSQFATAGLYAAVKAGFNDITKFGIEAGLIEENAGTADPLHKIYVTHLAVGTYWITQDYRREVNRIYRCLNITIEQAVKSYPDAKWSPQTQAEITKKNWAHIVTVHSIIEPNDDAMPGKVGRKNMPWRSLDWEECQTDKTVFLKESGYRSKPFWCARWECEGNDVYPTSWPALNALPDLRELQAQRKQSGDATDYGLRPPIGANGNTRLNFNPGSVTAVNATDANLWPKALWTVDPRFKGEITNDIAASKQNIDRHFYVDRFLPITSMQGVQPRVTQEIQLRNQEAIAQLGAPVSRLNREKGDVIVDRFFEIMARVGLFEPFPEELQDAELKTLYVSGLSQMRRLTDLDAIQRTAQFVGFLAGANPKVLDKFDSDQAVDEFANGAGVPPEVVRGDDDVDAIREARAKQEQMQQTAQMLPAAVDAAKAGQLMSQTQVGGQSLLDRATGQ